MSFRVLAIIAARSGSRGLRHKNIQTVGGATLLERAIHLAQAAALKKENWHIRVSTDSPRYAKIAESAGAHALPLRPKPLAGDAERLIDTVLYEIERYESNHEPPDAVVLLSATTPLTTHADVRRGMRLFHDHQGASVVSVCAASRPENWFFEMQRGKLTAPKGSAPIDRRQTAGSRYHLNGAVYIATPEWLKSHRLFFVSGKSVALTMPRERSVDIETALDLKWAEFLLARKHR